VLQVVGAPAEQVAAHLLLAPQRGDAATVGVLQAAARTAVDRGAADTAVTLLRRALDEPALGQDRLDVLLELGLVETLVDGPAAVRHLQEAWPLVDEPGLRGEIGIVLARTHAFTSERGVATAFARQARASLPPDQDDARQGLLALERVTRIMHALDPVPYGGGEWPEVSGSGPGARMLAATLSHELVLHGRDREGAVAMARFALDGDHLLDVDNGLLWVTAAMSLALADHDLGDFWDRADRHAHAQGSLFTALSVSLWRGHHEWLRGDLVDAVQSLRDALEQDRMWGSSGLGAWYSRAFLVQALVDRGELGEARSAVEELQPVAAVGEGQWLLRLAEARLLVAEGRPAEALAVLDLCLEGYGLRNPAGVPERGIRAEALHALGRTPEARALLEDDVRRLRAWGAPAFLGAGLRRLGDVTDDLDLLREAEALLAPSRAAVERARARWALGRRLPGPDGTQLLRAAHAEAVRTGAASLCRDVEAELCCRGAAPPPHDDVPPLTRTQQRALDLLRKGLDLCEVAQELFLTPGSVRATLQAAGASG
jgi:tetratricopeptide (TPR) repeat protein